MIKAATGAVDHEGRLATNILFFCRTLRRAGLPIGPGKVIEAAEAVRESGIERRDDFYFALRAVLVTDRSQFRLFDQAFHIYFRNPRLLERMMSLLLPSIERAGEKDAGDKAIRRLLESLSQDDVQDDREALIEVDRSQSSSRRELLRTKDFEQMSLRELRESRDLLRAEIRLMKNVPTRRFRANPSGDRYDLQRSQRLMLRNNGELIELAKKMRRLKPPALVLICDISGSMSRYSRVFLQFAHVMTSRFQTVHSFVFGTRLTNISHRLQDSDVDRALAQVARDVQDWDGGTRIGDCLQRFNVDWSRRVLAGRSIVILLSDGLERESGSDLGFQMRRLKRSCNTLIWLNPMLRYKQFEPKAMGIKAMLPHVDLFLPAHNVESLARLGEILRDRGDRSERTAA